ncbi:MAG: HD domain-containing protein [Fretibacterium sp.]|nr:HD domain-containing protein [Fretibacterium sp.]
MIRQHAELIRATARRSKGDTARIQHFIKVHGLASVIGTLEGLDRETQFILETAAILHDIGIRKSLEKYGSYTWKTQEEEGPAEAERLMREVGGFSREQIARVKYLIAHHHTYGETDGPDYRILLEADLLVNLHESQNKKKYEALIPRVFRTATGLELLNALYERGEARTE